MPKTQIFIFLTAICLVIGLFQLPKVIVKTQTKTLDNDIKDVSTSNAQEHKTKTLAEHSPKLSQTDLRAIALFKQNFYTKNQQTIWADSLASVFRKANMWDSAAYYIGVASEKATEQMQLLKAANAYYDAFSFAIQPNKAKTLAQKARAFYQKVLDKDPNLAEAKVKLGMTYTVSENPVQGILLIKEVLEKEPNNTLALMNLGLLSMQSKQYDKAVERFEKLVAIEPKNFEAKIYLAESYANTNKKQKAIDLLKKIQQEAPEASLRVAAADFLKQLTP